MRKINHEDVRLLFLRSSCTSEGIFFNCDTVIDWLKEQNKKIYVSINKVSFKLLKNWKVSNSSIRHESGKFFSVQGVRVKTDFNHIETWDQPIIFQPEVGYLGIITKEFKGVLYFLLQAKIEPGNVNYVQLSPTLQATRSNYSRVHKGKKPQYLEYFQNAKPHQVLLDQLQSEQGSRFFRKRNRNIIIKINDELPILDNFVWLTLGQIKNLIRKENLINMDTRSVLAGIPFGNFEPDVMNFLSFCNLSYKHKNNIIQKAFLESALIKHDSVHTIQNIVSFITHLKSVYNLEVRKIPLNKMRKWIFGKNEIHHEDDNSFKVNAVNVEIGNREVVEWNQPMIEPQAQELSAFVCKNINGLLHLAVQAKMECGNLDFIEFAPTVQCIMNNCHLIEADSIPFLNYVLNAKPEQVFYDVIQSEEGGRFFREQNRNMIVIAGDDFPVELPEKYIWMTLNQLIFFLKFNNYVNIQARSIISAINFV